MILNYAVFSAWVVTESDMMVVSEKKEKKTLSVWCQSRFPLFKLWIITSLLKQNTWK